MGLHRELLQWKLSNWFIALFVALATGTLSIAVTVEQSEAWFHLTCLFIGISTMWSIGSWLTSNLLRDLKPDSWNRQRKKRANTSDWRKFYVYQWIVPVLIIAIGAGSVYFVKSIQYSQELSQLEGRLYPAGETIPTHGCELRDKKDPLVVFLGSAIAVAESLPATVIKINGFDVLKMDRAEDGSLAISLEVRSEDGNIIAKVDRGEFLVNKNNYLQMMRTDRSSLKIIDQKGRIVLNMRYFNKHAMWIDANFGIYSTYGSRTPTGIPCTGNPNGGPMMYFYYR